MWVFCLFLGFFPPPYHQQIHPFYVGICLHIYIKMNKKGKAEKYSRKWGGGSRFSRNSSHTVKTSLSLPYLGRSETLLLTLSVTFRQLFCICISVLHFILIFSFSLIISNSSHPGLQSSPVQSSHPICQSHVPHPRIADRFVF